jgi:chloramphenicol 3-O-phosphotransferase
MFIQCHAALLNVQEVFHNWYEKWMHIDIDTFYKTVFLNKLSTSNTEYGYIISEQC